MHRRRFSVPVFSALFACRALAADCPADTVGTGLCACLEFGATLTGTDSTVTLAVLVQENEPLKAFQFEIIDDSDNALILRSARAGEKIEGWWVPNTETSHGTGLVFGFSLAGDTTLPGVGDTLVEVTFDIVRKLGGEIAFYLGSEGGVLLVDADAQNVACSYPDSGHAVSFPTDWLSVSRSIPGLPTEYGLEQNFPNPFNPVTTIEFHIKEMTLVEVSIYNLLGQRVVTPVDRVMSAGAHRVSWNGRNSKGIPVASGIYIYTLKTGSFVDRKKMVLLR